MKNTEALKNDELLHEFYGKEGHKYPALNLDQCKEVVFTPWIMLRKEMESGNLETVRLKYFGTFQVYNGRAKQMLSVINARKKFNKIDINQYFKLKDMLEKFLNRE
jgi:endonuclease/exonuclease/phosphatase (EEP) superfamily protein YafD